MVEHIRKLREGQDLLPRQVAAAMDTDMPLFSKTERGEHRAKREQVAHFARTFGAKRNEWPTRWLTDEIHDGIKDERDAAVAMRVAEKQKRLEKRNAPVKVRLPGDAISRDVLEWQK